jgi:hypothetical protein
MQIWTFYRATLADVTPLGKSVFLIYALLTCMSRKETVLFSSANGTTYLFDDSGVWYMKTDDIVAVFDIPKSEETRIWSLVDDRPNSHPIPSALTYAPSQLFFVAALFPDMERFRDAFKLPTIRRWWMTSWGSDEIFELYVITALMWRFQQLTILTLLERRSLHLQASKPKHGSALKTSMHLSLS